MSIELNHLIIAARDKWTSARFIADILGIEVGAQWANFVPLRLSNGITIDLCDSTDVRPQHYAFLVSEAEFDAALERLKRAGVAFFAEFDRSGPGEINHLYGGRGVYFDDPNGHLMEIITQPYGTTPERWVDGKAVKAPA
jgi:catechol 2,3-dioxygenase-like lactoylglutathione lyase family enzyme